MEFYEQLMEQFLSRAKEDKLLLDDVKWFFGLPEDMIGDTLQKVAQNKVIGLKGFSENFEEKIFALYEEDVPKAFEMYVKYYLNGFNKDRTPFSIPQLSKNAQVKMLGLSNAKDLLGMYRSYHELCTEAQEILLSNPELFGEYVRYRKIASSVLLKMFQADKKEELTAIYIKLYRLNDDDEMNMIKHISIDSKVISYYISHYGFREKTRDLLMVYCLQSLIAQGKTIAYIEGMHMPIG